MTDGQRVLPETAAPPFWKGEPHNPSNGIDGVFFIMEETPFLVHVLLVEAYPAVRYSYLDPNRDAANDQLTEVAGAVSYYFNRHNLKLQADIADIHDQATNKSDEMQYRLQAQIIF